MLSAIDLYYHSLLQTYEISDVRPQWMLTPELESFEVPAPDKPPQSLFGIGEGFPHLPRAIASGCRISFHRSPHPNPLP
jgi:hypothetical protein